MSTAFNEIEVRETLQVVKEVNGAWFQGKWRVFRGQQAFDHPIDSMTPADNACGTSMCLAGWYAQRKGTWLVTSSMVQKLAAVHGFPLARALVGTMAYYQVLPEGERMDGDRDLVSALHEWGIYPGNSHNYEATNDLVEQLRETYGDDLWAVNVIPVWLFARERLGLTSDPLDLFGGVNTMEDLEDIVDWYSKYGTSYEASRGFHKVRMARIEARRQEASA